MNDNLANTLRRQLYGKKITGYVILVALCLVFVFFGYSAKNKSMGTGSVAQVNNALVSLADFTNEENRVQQYYQNIFGGSVDLGAQRNMLRQQALENLIQSELVLQAAQKDGIMATDDEVRMYITRDIPAFQEKGEFQRDRYMAYLENTHTKAGDFENRIRKDIENIRTHHLVELATRPMNLEVAKMKELQENKLNLAFVKLDPDVIAKGLKISDSEISKKLADPVFLQKAKDHFEANKSQWSKPEMVTAQHILIGAKGGDPGSFEKALAVARSMKTRAGTEDFGALASKYSEDPGSKTKKGMLEPFGRGKMVKEFEDAAFALKPGEISEPVKTQYGYHVIKVTKHTEAVSPTFDQVKNEVAGQLIAREKAEESLKTLEDAVAKSDLKAVDEALHNMNVKWDETGYFDLAADAIPKLPPGPVADAAFEVSAAKPLLNHVIHESGARFLIKFKDAKVDTSKVDEKNNPEMLERRRAENVYGGWLTKFRQASRIDVNQDAFQR